MLEVSDESRLSWVARLREGLAKTRGHLSGLFGDRPLDQALLSELEDALIASDVGVETTHRLLGQLRTRIRNGGKGQSLRTELRAILLDLIAPLEQTFTVPERKPCVIMLVGVNGTGKTTSIGKLARFFGNEGYSVLLAAGDTFRAAAQEQLASWARRNAVSFVSQAGGDPAAVAFDAVSAARARGTDIVIADTAGRLPTQKHLMEELKKIKRAIAKAEAGAPHEVWLVLDAGTGRNAFSQLDAFNEALGVTGLILTKLDGTAKGGVVCSIAIAQLETANHSKVPAQHESTRKDPIPLRFLGVGEGIDDLRPFAARDFVSALLD